MWLFEKSQQRADEYGIQGVSYRLTQGMVVKDWLESEPKKTVVFKLKCEEGLIVQLVFIPLIKEL